MQTTWNFNDLTTEFELKNKQWRVELAQNNDTRQQSMQIRKVVFIDEQGVSEEEEIDDLEDFCEHFLLLDIKNSPQATARLWVTPEGKGKLQRIAVLKAARGQYFGQVLVLVMEERCRERKISELILGAQCEAIGFYQKLGYEAYGDIFDDAGIDHKMMRKSL